jgi:hypothetical protein
MGHDLEIEAIMEQVKPWPQEERVALAYEILRELRKQTVTPAPRRTLQRALGIARGESAPPDDATVQKWIEEYRLKKHG